MKRLFNLCPTGSHSITADLMLWIALVICAVITAVCAVITAVSALHSCAHVPATAYVVESDTAAAAQPADDDDDDDDNIGVEV